MEENKDEIQIRFGQKYHVSRETFLQLSDYVEILKKWQAKVNLISNNTIAQIWKRHIEDSLQLASYVPRETSGIIDIGSGGGLPAIVLAAATKLPVVMVESDMKKCIFLNEACRNLDLTNCKAYTERAEKAKVYIADKSHILITARALAEITEIFRLAFNLKNNNDLNRFTLILPKGKTAAIELDKAKQDWSFEVKSHPSVTEPEASILVISNLERKQ